MKYKLCLLNCQVFFFNVECTECEMKGRLRRLAGLKVTGVGPSARVGAHGAGQLAVFRARLKKANPVFLR
jgi:hypothetical protein